MEIGYFIEFCLTDWFKLNGIVKISVLSGSAIMCHRCVSAMGGCGDDLDWRMFPWRDCGDSEFCVKIIKKVGSKCWSLYVI